MRTESKNCAAFVVAPVVLGFTDSLLYSLARLTGSSGVIVTEACEDSCVILPGCQVINTLIVDHPFCCSN